MVIKILGCSGNYVGRHRTTSFLIDESFLIDAGTVTEAVAHTDLTKIKRLLVTHTHMDHLKGLFSLVDELIMMGDYSVELISAERVLDIISNNLLNNLIWPDFTVLPSVSKAVIKFRNIPLEKPTHIDGISVLPIIMEHTVYTVGYIIRQDDGAGFMFTADTGPTRRFWEIACEEKDIRFIIADVSFPDRLIKLAIASGHMTPSLLFASIDRYGLGDTLFYVTHVKPIFSHEILAEIHKSGRKNIRVLKQSKVLKM